MKHFLNDKLLAPNVLTVGVDHRIVREFLPLAHAALPTDDHSASRPHWNSDIRWVAPTSVEAFETFESAFRRLAIAEHVAPFLDLESQVRVYAGFLVVRSDCAEPNFHLDWEKTNNEAFTLITPVTDHGAGFGLLYRKLNGEVGEYDYKPGEAIIFGDHFVHSTKPGRSDEPVVLLSFTFGTDKMEHWDKIAKTAAYQSKLVRRPDGEFVTGGG